MEKRTSKAYHTKIKIKIAATAVTHKQTHRIIDASTLHVELIHIHYVHEWRQEISLVSELYDTAGFI